MLFWGLRSIFFIRSRFCVLFVCTSYSILKRAYCTFEFLLTTYAEMQTNLVRVGEQVAYDTVIERVTDYCLQHAIEDGY